MLKVLLLDDNHDNRFLVSRILKHLDCDVTEFADPEKALALLKVGNPYQMIFTDLNMPNMNGVQFIERVIAEYPDAFIVATSVTDYNELKDEAMEKGASYGIFGLWNRASYQAALDALKKR